MLKPEDTRRGVRQIDAVVEAMGALAPDEVNAVRVAVVQCIDDLQGNRRPCCTDQGSGRTDPNPVRFT